MNFVEYFDTISKPTNHVRVRKPKDIPPTCFGHWRGRSSSGRCITNDIYMEILQKVLNY